MFYIALLLMLIFTAAAAVDLCPGGQKLSRQLLLAGCVLGAVASIACVVIKEGMFRDIMAVPLHLWYKTSLAMAVLGVFTAFVIAANRNNKDR